MEELRPLLTTYAYNIVGSYEDARDLVQDAYVKFMGVAQEQIDNKKAYLVRTVINLSINFKKRQQKWIDQYPGEWLPEPVATDHADTLLNRKEVLSYSLLVLLERLNPRQRAVFILKEAFDYDHDEIAEALGITAENSRQLLSRARSRLRAPLPEEEKMVPVGYLDKFLEVIRLGDTARLEQLLHDDIVVISDGGGKAVAFVNPVAGKKSVVALLLGLANKFYNTVRIEQGILNHEPALLYFDDQDKLITTQVFHIKDGKLVNAYFMRNPDKLKALGEIF